MIMLNIYYVQCQKRYEELLKEGIHSTSVTNYAFTMTRANSVPAAIKTIKAESEQNEKGSRPSSAKVKGLLIFRSMGQNCFVLIF